MIEIKGAEAASLNARGLRRGDALMMRLTDQDGEVWEQPLRVEERHEHEAQSGRNFCYVLMPFAGWSRPAVGSGE